MNELSEGVQELIASGEVLAGELVPLPSGLGRLTMRDYQVEAVDAIYEAWREYRSVIAVVPTGGGKCLGKGTPVVCFDGSVKNVEDVVAGDVLMGPDSRPRNVLSTTTGHEEMFRIEPNGGDVFTCNASHILSLKMTKGATKGSGTKGSRYLAGTIHNLSVRDYLAASNTFRHCAKGYRVSVELTQQDVPVDPYFLGLWLGDGTTRSTDITTPDSEIVTYLHSFADSQSLTLRCKQYRNRCATYSLTTPDGKPNPLRESLRRLGVSNTDGHDSKHIPACYLRNSTQVRLALLAGLLDTDGYLHNGGFEISSKSERLTADIVFLARSLGFRVVQSSAYKTCQTGNGGTYFRISISGDCARIPTLIKRKQCQPRRQKKDHLVFGFKVESIGHGAYYGFELDGDGLFLLGDFTVTHNTVIAAETICRWPGEGRWLFIAHVRELIFQAQATIERHIGETPAIEMGMHREGSQGHGILDRARVLCASIQSLTRRLEKFRPTDFDGIIWDEFHHSSAKTYRSVWEYFKSGNPAIRSLGITATPHRSDGISLKGIAEFCAYEMGIRDAIDLGWLVPIRQQYIVIEDLDFSKCKTVAKDLNEGDLEDAMMGGRINDAMTEDERREVLVKQERMLHAVAAPLVKESCGRSGIVFCVTVDHATRMAEILRRYPGVTAEVLVGETPDDLRAEAVRSFKAGDTQFLVGVGVMCLDTETEILTSTGWVGIDDMTPAHLVANWNFDGTVFFETPRAIVRRDRMEGECIISARSKRHSIRVTGDHRMIYRTSNELEWRVSHAAALADRHIFVPVSGTSVPSTMPPETHPRYRNLVRRINSNSYILRKKGMSKDDARREAATRIFARESLRHLAPSELSLDACRFIGFYLAEGSCNRLRKGGVEYVITQTDACKNIVVWFEELISRLPYDFVRSNHTNDRGRIVTRWHFCRGTGFGSQQRRGLYPIESYLDKDGTQLLWGLDTNQFAAFIEGLWFGDGDHGQLAAFPDRRVRITGQRPLFDLVQAIAVCRGYYAALRPERKPVKATHKQLYRLSLTKKQYIAIERGVFVKEDTFVGERVWCVTSTTGNIITRRDGIVTVTGNTEGFDCPNADIVAMARPTKSESLYKQMIGRGLRPLAGLVDRYNTPEERCEAIANSRKSHCLVLDFVGNSGSHKLVSTADVLAGDMPPDLVELAKHAAMESGHAVDIREEVWKQKQKRDEEELARQEKERQRQLEQQAREEARRQRLHAEAQYKTREIDAFDVHDQRTQTSTPAFRGGSTDAQISLLKRLGISEESAMKFSKRQAGAVIDDLTSRVGGDWIMRFGKHVGQSLREIQAGDADYFRWMTSNIQNDEFQMQVRRFRDEWRREHASDAR